MTKKVLVIGGGNGVGYSEKWENYLKSNSGFSFDFTGSEYELVFYSGSDKLSGRVRQVLLSISSLLIILKTKPDVVYLLYSPVSFVIALCCKLFNVKVVSDLRSDAIYGSKLGRILRKLLLKVADGCTVVSEAMYEKYISYIKKCLVIGPVFNKEYMTKILNYDCDKEGICESVKEFIQGDVEVYLYSGSVDRSRPIAKWLKVILSNQRRKVILAGSVKDPKILDMDEEYDNLLVLGQVDSNHLVWLYNNCDFGLNPLSNEYGVQPSLKVLEYMAGGMRVFSTMTDGIERQLSEFPNLSSKQLIKVDSQLNSLLETFAKDVSYSTKQARYDLYAIKYDSDLIRELFKFIDGLY